jgi:hypothetical protein
MKLDIQQIYDAARAAGFTPDQATTWTAIALAESGGETGAHNPHGEDSLGLWQINLAAHKNIWGDLSNPVVNARAAYDISHHGTDMRPWTTTHASHQGGPTDYRTYLPEVSAVTGYAGDGRGVAGYGSPLPDPLPPSTPTGDATMTTTSPTTSYDVIDLGAQPDSQLDSDHDGLTDAFERMTGSNPLLADSDHDNLSDAYEVAVSHTNPMLADTDADTLPDSAEVALGTSPTSVDTDHDGMTDVLEVRAGTDPLRPSPGASTAGHDVGHAAAGAGSMWGAHDSALSAGTMSADATGGVAPQSFQGKDPWAKIDLQGQTVDNFTAAALQDAAQEAGTHWRLLQGSFTDDVAASGSTHAGGGVVDVAPEDGDWEGAVTALRKIGFAAWIRNVPGHASVGSGQHIHAVLIGDKLMSSEAHIQVVDYMHDDNGLAGSTPDDGPRQFIHNRFSWNGGAADPMATSTSFDQIDAGVSPHQVGDTDGDGLTDAFERAHGLDPFAADSDHDGQPDGVELLAGTNPLAAGGVGAGMGAGTGAGAGAVTTYSLNGLDPSGDADGDHLSNAYEVQHGLDPLQADTDHDGLSDATELALGTNPSAIDTDMDGLTDHAELELGTDPLVADDPHGVGPDAAPMDDTWSDPTGSDGGHLG